MRLTILSLLYFLMSLNVAVAHDIPFFLTHQGTAFLPFLQQLNGYNIDEYGRIGQINKEFCKKSRPAFYQGILDGLEKDNKEYYEFRDKFYTSDDKDFWFGALEFHQRHLVHVTNSEKFMVWTPKNLKDMSKQELLDLIYTQTNRNISMACSSLF